jgi:hypothetical protein
MELSSDSFIDGGTISTEHALAKPAEPGPVELAANKNPHLAWKHVPEGTQSFVVTCIDGDAPTSAEDVNKPDREVPATLPRADFVHWLLADLPGNRREIPEGSHADSVIPGGKDPRSAPEGVHGVNDYTGWFADDPDMAGIWCGYDGPAPPWNDAIPHRYTFTVYALDIPSLGLEPGFSRTDLNSAIDGHVLATASITGRYTANRRLLHDR